MTDTYRGFDVPEVHEDTPRGFFILDERFNWLVRGATEEYALGQWRRNVDSHILKNLVAEGSVTWLFETREGLQVYGCNKCGSMLHDPLQHAEANCA